MRRKSLLILLSVFVLSTVLLISAAILYTFPINMSATVPAQGSVTIRVDSTNYTNGQPMTVNWGTVNWGTNNKAINITNNANVALTPHITTTGLPSGWGLTLSLEDLSIAIGSTAQGNLILTIPTGTAHQTYSWSASITVEYT